MDAYMQQPYYGACELLFLRDMLSYPAKKKTTTPAFFLVDKCAKFLFWSKVEAACGLETVITVITVIDSPSSYIDHMDDSSSSSSSSVRLQLSSEFFPAYLRPCAS
jgi:hypothetical protein